MIKKISAFLLIFITVTIGFLVYNGRKINEKAYEISEVVVKKEEVATSASVSIPVMKVGEEIVYYPEFEFYLLAKQKDYEAGLGKEVWNIRKNGKTSLDLLKAGIIEEIARLKIVVNEAKKAGYTISEEEEKEIRSVTKAQLAGIDPVIKAKYYLDEDLLAGIYMENFLATKFFGGYSKKLRLTGERAKARFSWKYAEWEKEYEAEIYWGNINEMSVESRPEDVKNDKRG